MPAPITLKVSGSLLDQEGLPRLAEALHRVPDEASIALVHGGGPQLDEALAKLDEPIEHRQGLRVTSRAQAGVVQATLDRVGSQLTAALGEAGLPVHHVDSFERRLIGKPKQLEEGPELGRVGTPVRLDTHGLFEEGAIPVLTPVGTDGTGPLNVNADEAAAALAAETASQALVFATAVPGVLDARGQAILHLDPDRARGLVAQETAQGGMKPKIEAALAALSDGVQRVHVAPLTPAILSGALQPGPGPGTCLTAHEEVPA